LLLSFYSVLSIFFKNTEISINPSRCF